MLIPKSELKTCLDKAAEISEYYNLIHLDARSTVRSADNLIGIVETHEQKKVEVVTLHVEAADHPVKGFYFSGDDGYSIALLSGLNFCWRRFVLCKELFHVILDAEAYRTMDFGALIDECFNTFPPDDAARPALHSANELTAEICAMDFLFPYADRIRLRANGKESDAIASQYKIPKVFVERYLSESYMNNLRQFHPLVVAA